jgi:hypothetical protein
MDAPPVDEVIALIHLDEDAIAAGRRRQAAVGKNEETDALPLLLEGVPVPERERYCRTGTDHCRYNPKQRFYDKRKMLFEQLWGMASTARSKSDSQPTASVDLGAGFAPSILGLKQLVFEDKDPWLQQRLSKEQISAIDPKGLGDVSRKGLMPRALDYFAYFQQKLPNAASVCIYPDTLWGPFSLAHLIRGDDLFMDLHDDPPFVHHLMEVATSLYVECARLLKQALGEPEGRACQGGFYLSSSGVWSNEDTAVLVSRAQAEEFVFPYLRKAYAPFDGTVIHFCGRADHLLEPLLEIPEIKGINLGEPQAQQISYEQIMEMVLDKGKAYYGGWPRQEGQTTDAYFSRLLAPLAGEKRGLVLTYNLTEAEQREPRRVMDLWHSLN